MSRVRQLDSVMTAIPQMSSINPVHGSLADSPWMTELNTWSTVEQFNNPMGNPCLSAIIPRISRQLQLTGTWSGSVP